MGAWTGIPPLRCRGPSRSPAIGEGHARVPLPGAAVGRRGPERSFVAIVLLDRAEKLQPCRDVPYLPLVAGGAVVDRHLQNGLPPLHGEPPRRGEPGLIA